MKKIAKNPQKFIDQLRNSKDPETATKGCGYFITWADGRARVGYKHKQDAINFISQGTVDMGKVNDKDYTNMLLDVVKVEYREAEKSGRVRNKFTTISAKTYQIMKKALNENVGYRFELDDSILATGLKIFDPKIKPYIELAQSIDDALLWQDTWYGDSGSVFEVIIPSDIKTETVTLNTETDEGSIITLDTYNIYGDIPPENIKKLFSSVWSPEQQKFQRETSKLNLRKVALDEAGDVTLFTSIPADEWKDEYLTNGISINDVSHQAGGKPVILVRGLPFYDAVDSVEIKFSKPKNEVYPDPDVEEEERQAEGNYWGYYVLDIKPEEIIETIPSGLLRAKGPDGIDDYFFLGEHYLRNKQLPEDQRVWTENMQSFSRSKLNMKKAMNILNMDLSPEELRQLAFDPNTTSDIRAQIVAHPNTPTDLANLLMRGTPSPLESGLRLTPAVSLSKRKKDRHKFGWDNPPRNEDYHPGSNVSGPVPYSVPKSPGSKPRRDQRTIEDYHAPSQLDRDPIPGEPQPEQGTGGQPHSGDPEKVDNIYPEPMNWLRPLKGLPFTDEHLLHDFNEDFDTDYYIRQRGLNLRRRKFALNMQKEAEVNPKYDYGTVQTSDVSEIVTDAIKDIQGRIDKDKLYDGEDEPGWVENGIQKLFHITVLFGVNDNVKDEVKKVFDKYKPVHIETTGVEYFDTNPDFDVAIVKCKSEELTKIHDELKDTLENEETYPNYNPHITIAYLKKGEKLDDNEQITDTSWEVDSLDISTSDGQLEKISALAIPIRESLDYPHSWRKKKKKKDKEIVTEKEKKILQMDSNKLNLRKKAQYEYGYDWRQRQFPEEYGASFIDAVPENIEGYDFGGSEGPFHPGLAIVDIGSPEEFDYPGSENLIEGDLETPLNLEPKPFINISNVVGELAFSKRDVVASNIDRALLPGGRVRLLDMLPALQPILKHLKDLGYKKIWGHLEKESGFYDDNDNPIPGQEIILQKPQAKRASILDEPRASLDEAIWDIGRDDLPMLKPSVKIHIVKNFFEYISQFGGYIKPEEFIKNMFYTGSTATYTYSDTSDIDIHVIVDWIDLAALNPDKARKDPQEMWRELHDIFWWTLNKIKLPGTKHPLTYYVMPPGDEKKLINQKEELYDIGHDVWLIPPGKATNLTEEVIDPALEEASEFMARINQHIADARKGVIDYALLREVITPENAASRYVQIAEKLREIDTDLKALKDEYALLKQKRKDAFEKGDSLVGGNSNYSLGNIIFKLVERYKYMDILRKIRQITDDMDLRPNQVQEIANVLGLDLEEE